MKIHNFISTDALYDGEQERRIHYNGVTAKETAVTTEAATNNTRFVGFEVFAAVTMKNAVFWDVMSCRLIIN
jgi:hypothetical protein